MPCYCPLEGYWSREVGESGKRRVVFDVHEGYHDLPVKVPCGQCVGCRLERSRQWAIRCMHEASLHDENCFITLTYADEYLPERGSLDRKAFPKFMKRLRKRYEGRKIRYFHCGEYGTVSLRPHYHACLFGFDFEDKELWTTRGGFPVWRSSVLEKLWPFGLSEVGSVTFESAAYVARYIMKRRLGDGSEAEGRDSSVSDGVSGDVCVEREYATMSRRPGIGREWLEKFGGETYLQDGVVVRGRLMRPPKYYDDQFESLYPDVLESIKKRRRSARDKWNESWSRLEVRREVAEAKLNLKSREVV